MVMLCSRADFEENWCALKPDSSYRDSFQNHHNSLSDEILHIWIAHCSAVSERGVSFDLWSPDSIWLLGGAPLLKNGCCEIHMWQLKIIEIASSATILLTTVLSVWSATGTLGALFWMMLHSYWNGKTPPSPISLWKQNVTTTLGKTL